MSSKVLSSRIKEISQLSLDLEKIEMNTYYIQALNDRLVSTGNLDSFTKISDKLKVIKIDGPHFILQVRPKECAEFIINEMQLIE
jgi:surfactin synthase thioesterase subunit